MCAREPQKRGGLKYRIILAEGTFVLDINVNGIPLSPPEDWHQGVVRHILSRRRGKRYAMKHVIFDTKAKQGDILSTMHYSGYILQQSAITMTSLETSPPEIFQ